MAASPGPQRGAALVSQHGVVFNAVYRKLQIHQLQRSFRYHSRVTQTDQEKLSLSTHLAAREDAAGDVNVVLVAKFRTPQLSVFIRDYF